MKKTKISFLTILFVIIANQAFAAKYLSDYTKSYIKFDGTHAGKVFTGTFKKWNAEVEFDEQNLSKSSVKVTIDMTSAKTGDKMYDGTLPTADWFSTDQFKNAEFKSNKITKNSDGSYKIKGNLQIREVTLPIIFNFKLKKIDATNAETKFDLVIDRLLFSIGKKSDGNAEWVSKEIEIEVFLKAKSI